MLKLVYNMQELPFSELVHLYRQELALKAKREYSDRGDGFVCAELDLREYLSQVFFRSSGAVYCLWTQEGKLVSALRLEPYGDGYLLTALETDPDQRCRGFAGRLIRAALEQVAKDKPVYSHIAHKNRASIGVHRKSGFVKISDHARLLDGTVSAQVGTYCYMRQEEEKCCT